MPYPQHPVTRIRYCIVIGQVPPPTKPPPAGSAATPIGIPNAAADSPHRNPERHDACAAVFHPSPEPEAPLFYTVRNHRRARMSDDNVARFIRQHAATARARCPDVPARVHPHMLRHSRAMHLYQAGHAVGPAHRVARARST